MIIETFMIKMIKRYVQIKKQPIFFYWNICIHSSFSKYTTNRYKTVCTERSFSLALFYFRILPVLLYPLNTHVVSTKSSGIQWSERLYHFRLLDYLQYLPSPLRIYGPWLWPCILLTQRQMPKSRISLSTSIRHSCFVPHTVQYFWSIFIRNEWVIPFLDFSSLSVFLYIFQKKKELFSKIFLGIFYSSAYI